MFFHRLSTKSQYLRYRRKGGISMSHSLWRWGIAMLALCALFVVVPAHATSHVTCGQWNIVPSPNPSPTSNYLNGVATISPSDVWAVGAYANDHGKGRTLFEHWDG